LEQAKSFIPTFASKLKLDWWIHRRLLYLLNILLCLSDMLTDTYHITQEKNFDGCTHPICFTEKSRRIWEKCSFLLPIQGRSPINQ
jgi:hypothetical protein